MENNKYKEITCESAMNKLKRRMPYSWEFRNKYSLSNSYSKPMKEKLNQREWEQDSLF